MNERGISTPAFCLALGIFLVCMLAFFGCAGEPEEKSTASTSRPEAFDPMAVELTDPGLLEGRKTWMATCSQCHLTGLGGAPKIGDVSAWASRIAKGKDALYKNAIEGFWGPTYNQMPAKGGFSDLSDEEVMRAVDFVTSASQ